MVAICPTLIGLMTAVGVLRASGFLEFLGGFLGSFTEKIGIPGDIIPLTLVRMFSSSAASGLLLDIFQEHGIRIKDRPHGCHHTQLHRKYLLLHERLFRNYKSKENKIRTTRCPDCHSCRCGSSPINL